MTRAALHAKRKAGERIGAVPFGWEADADGRLVPVAREQSVISEIQTMRSAGVGFHSIARALTRAGHATKHGGPWYGSSVRSVFLRTQALTEESA